MNNSLPKLEYSYSSLEPYIDEKTMRIHHTLHHAGYINNLKILISNNKLKNKKVYEIILNKNIIPSNIKSGVMNNAGGHLNHSFFWKIMSPKKYSQKGKLAEKIKETFSNFEIFKEKFILHSSSHFGSGWGWLIFDGKELKIITTNNQDTPIEKGNFPIIGVDVWEHAYYLKYQNKRIDYLNGWWNVINWNFAEQNFIKAIKKKYFYEK